MQRESPSPTLPIGSTLPIFSLPSTDGRTINSASFFANSKMALVMFTCNHCPYVKGSEEGIIATINEFAKYGLKAAFISANDATQYPEDSFEKMKLKSAAWKDQFPQLDLPYLYDESQAVARTFDAACTPECYLFVDGKLAFHGAPNSNPRDGSAPREPFLGEALAAALAGKPQPAPYRHPIGCSIKWRS